MKQVDNSLLRILLLEDITTDAELIELELKEGGIRFEVCRVDKKHDFLKALKSFHPDIVLSDYLLPDFDGISAMKIVLQESPEIPFIFVSGEMGEEKAIDSLKTGATDYVLKDRMTRLVPAVKRALMEVEERKERKNAELESRKQKEFLYTALNSLTHPFYIINVDDYNISLANKAALFMQKKKRSTCYALTHAEHEPCQGPDHPCPIDIIKRTKEPTVVEHVHMTADGERRIFEIHAYPLFEKKNQLTQVIEYAIDITKRKDVEESLKQSLAEKEILLKEIHHRVKNNLQVISSLLHLQSREIEDERILKLFLDSQSRVRSMALIHEKLYQSKDLRRIHFADYVKSLVKGLFRAYMVDPGRIEINVQADDINLNIELSVPCGLVINELVSNILKYAFPPEFKGKPVIGVSLKEVKKNEIELIVKDNGIGLTREFQIDGSKSLGFRLVKILVEDQLKGDLVIESDKGMTALIRFRI